MEKHVNIIGIIEIIFGALAALAGVVVMALAGIGGALLSTASEAPAGTGGLIAGIGLGLGILIIGIGVLEIVAGIALRSYKPWARIVVIILAALGLLSFPIGTAFGVYVLWALLNKDTVALFEPEAAA